MAEFADAKSGAYCMCTREKCSDECRTYRQFHPKPITNGDRIRSMTDEELANWLSSFCTCGEYEDTCPAIHCKGCGWADCSEPWLDWLQQEVADG